MVASPSSSSTRATTFFADYKNMQTAMTGPRRRRPSSAAAATTTSSPFSAPVHHMLHTESSNRSRSTAEELEREQTAATFERIHRDRVARPSFVEIETKMKVRTRTAEEAELALELAVAALEGLKFVPMKLVKKSTRDFFFFSRVAAAKYHPPVSHPALYPRVQCFDARR